MSSEETDRMLEELLKIYARRYQKPEFVLNHHIDGLVKEGRTKEQAVLFLYTQITKEEKLSEEVEEIYRRLLTKYADRGFTNPEGTLELTLKTFIDEGKTRERAIRELWKNESYRSQNRHEVDIEQLREKINRLAVLFSQGEISEDSYKESVKAIEGNIDRLRRGVEIPTVMETRVPPTPYVRESDYVEHIEPSGLWWLVPFFFGIIGGIVAYVGVKDDDEDMAFNLLVFGILWSIAGIILYFVGLSYLLNRFF